MKVGVFLKDGYSPTEGGGYSYYERLISSIDQLNVSGVEFKFISAGKNLSEFSKPVVALQYQPSRLLRQLLSVVRMTKWIVPKSISNKLEQRSENDKIKYYRRTLAQAVDIVFYPTQAQLNIKEIPYILTNWDLGHRTSYTFPEFVDDGEFLAREQFYDKDLRKALAVFVESEAGREELVRYLNINPKRIFVVPLFPGKVVELNIAENKQYEYLTSHQLSKQKYFFYPAQFWAHKNHHTLVAAFHQFSAENPDFKLVFVGADKGNKEYINRRVAELKLDDVVLFLGFVSDEELYTLYRNSCALVMPTLLGPTNMPLLEAQYLGIPVICSDFEGHRELLGEEALYVDPLDRESIFLALSRVVAPDFEDYSSRDIVGNVSKNSLEKSMDAFSNVILQIKKVRDCWD